MQKDALVDYALGDFAYLIGEPPKDMSEVDDGLLRFLLIELSDNEDCEDINTAYQRLENAQSDLEIAIDAIRKLEALEELEVESDAPKRGREQKIHSVVVNVTYTLGRQALRAPLPIKQ